MNDMTQAIQPKATELTADDLLTGPRTIKITGVNIKPGAERPVIISFDGDDGRPFLPCKTVSRILVNAWGPDAKAYIGRSITLFRDPTVKWGGLAVGGLRPSHLSNIDAPMTLAVTMSKGSKKAITVQPIPKPAKAAATPANRTAPASSASENGTATEGGSPGSGATTATTSDDVTSDDVTSEERSIIGRLNTAATLDALISAWKAMAAEIAALSPNGKTRVTAVKDARKVALTPKEDEE